jgi:hypothetical protein
VFLAAAAVMLVGFALTWLLKDVRLRTTAATENARSASTAARLAYMAVVWHHPPRPFVAHPRKELR